MEATIDIKFLQGINELVIKELAFLFRAPYHMEPHGS